MTERSDDGPVDMRQPCAGGGNGNAPRRWQAALGWAGLIMAIPFFAWAPLALVAPVPSMIEVFGVAGLRIPASVTVGGLLLAAVGFHRF